MGTRFEYIADAAIPLVLAPGMATCGLCNHAVEELFEYSPEALLVDGAKRQVGAICETCLRAGPQVHEDALFKNTVVEYVSSLTGIGQAVPTTNELLARIGRSPRPIFVQGMDWPLCCADFCDLQGDGDDRLISEQAQGSHYWEQGPVQTDDEEDWTQSPPELGSDLLFFRCRTCAKRYFTFQPS